MFHTRDTVIRPKWKVVLSSVLLLLAGIYVLHAVAFAGDPEDAYATQLDALQERINAAQSGEVPPPPPTDKETELQQQIVEVELRAVRAEAALALCKAELIVAKEGE